MGGMGGMGGQPQANQQAVVIPSQQFNKQANELEKFFPEYKSPNQASQEKS